MLTEQDVANEYNLDAYGCVTNPGRFEGEHWTTLALYDLTMVSAQDETLQWADDEYEAIFIVDDEMRSTLDLNPSTYAVGLYEESQGFVSCQQYTQKSYNTLIEAYEKANEDVA